MIKIYGKNCIYEAIRAQSNLLEAFVLDKEVQKEGNLINLLKDKKIKYNVVDKKTIDKLFGPDNQGYGAYRVEYDYKDLKSLFNDKTKRKQVLLLDGISDPHNFGAILRSADAFGVDAVVICKNRSVGVTSSVAKVSTGAIEYVDIIQVNNLNNSIRELKDNGFWIVGTDASGVTRANSLDKTLNLAIIIGSEGFGMSKLVKDQCDFILQIPMTGHVNSLNASVSAGIVLALLNQ